MELSKECSEKDDIYIFRVQDYSTELVGRKNDKGGFFYIQRGDGCVIKYEEYRITSCIRIRDNAWKGFLEDNREKREDTWEATPLFAIPGTYKEKQDDNCFEFDLDKPIEKESSKIVPIFAVAYLLIVVATYLLASILTK